MLLVRRGEYAQVTYLFTLFVTIGVGMALGRGTADALFFKRYGIEYLPAMYVLVSFLLSGVSVIYAAFVDMIPAERFFKILFGTLAGLLVANWMAITSGGSDWVYPAYFLLYEVASELLLVHGALYLGQNLVQTQSKRLTPLILAGQQVGVITGGLLLAIASPVFGVHNILLLWILLLGAGLLLVSRWHGRHGHSPYFRPGRRNRSKLRQSAAQLGQGLRLMSTSSLLRASSIALFFMVIATYLLTYSVNSVYTRQFPSEEALGSFFGVLTAVTSTVALLLQVFVTNRLIRRFGVKSANLIFPSASLLSFACLSFSFSLPAALFGSFSKDVLMPAFRNPARNIYLDALPGQIQGRARAMSIVIVMPVALLVAGAILWATQRLEGLVPIALLGTAAAALYLFSKHRVNAAYVGEIVANLRQRLFLKPEQVDELARDQDERVLRELERGARHEDDEISLTYSRILVRAAPERAAEVLPLRLQTAGAATKDQFIQILRPLKRGTLLDQLRASVGTADAHLDATIFAALLEARDPRARTEVPRLLDHQNPRLRAMGLYGALRYPIRELEEQALTAWRELLCSDSPDAKVSGIELYSPAFERFFRKEPLRGAIGAALLTLLGETEARVVRIALDKLRLWPREEVLPGLVSALAALAESPDWNIRSASLKCSHLLPEPERQSILSAGIEDVHPLVRKTALCTMMEGATDSVGYLLQRLTSNTAGSPRSQETMIRFLIESGASPDVMLRISCCKAEDARLMWETRANLRRYGLAGNGMAELLSQVLEERLFQYADLALLALQSSEQDEGIAVIRAGIKSREPRQFAGACELLSHIAPPQIALTILPALEDADGGQTVASGVGFDSVDSLYRWGQSLSDPWLRECVTYAAGAKSP